MGPRTAQPGAESMPDHLQQAGHIEGFGAQVGGKQHKPRPATAAVVRGVLKGLITAITGMKQQWSWIALKDLRWLRGNSQQSVCHEQCTGGAMQTAHLLKAADTQVKGAQ